MATLEQIEAALRAADAAGNTEDARRLAQAYSQARSAQGNDVPVANTQAAAPHASDVPLSSGANPYDDLMPAAMAPEKSFGQKAGDFGMSLGRAGVMQLGSIAKGVPAIADIVVAPVAAQIDRGAQALGADPKYFSGGEKGLAGYVQSGLDAAGVPHPQTGIERFADRAMQGLGGLLGGAGFGRALLAGESVPAQAVGRALTENLGGQTMAVTAGNTAGQITHEAGGSPGLELGFSLLGSGVPALAGGAYQGLSAAARKSLGTPDAETLALAQRAQELGIPLKASQIGNSKAAKYVDSFTGEVPFSGGRAFNEEQQAAFNRAVSRTIGEDADKITPAVFNQARARIGSEFNRLAAASDLSLTPDVTAKLNGIIQDTRSYFGDEAGRMVTNVLNRLAAQQQNGVIPGKAFQSIDSGLGQAIAAGGEKSVPLRNLQETLRDAVESNLSPQDAAAWSQARRQYRDLKTIESLVASDGMTTGNVSWGKLLGRVTANGAGKASMARGDRGDLGDLAAVGQRFLKDQVPNSGTAQRMAVLDALKSVGPTLGIGALATGSGLSGSGLVSGLGNAALTGLSAIGASRLAQRVNQNPELVNALLGQPSSLSSLRQGVQTSTQPTLLSLLGSMSR